MSGFGKISPVPAPPGSPEERVQRAIDELRRRGANNDYCPRCSTFDWNVDLLEIPATSALSSKISSGAGFGGRMYPRPYSDASGVLPMLSIVCKNCGYTMFHNLNNLGV